MSIFGALNASVSGLQAQSDALGVISDNISNSNTVGFKERKAVFESLVVNSGESAGFSPGGVVSESVNMANEQGQLRATNTNTDLAISGDGFFAVKSASGGANEGTLKYTRAGQFRINNNGVLQNSSGFALQGWQIDQQGNLPPDQQNPASLQAVDVNGLSGQARATSKVSIGANLPAQTDDATKGSTLQSDDFGLSSGQFTNNGINTSPINAGLSAASGNTVDIEVTGNNSSIDMTLDLSANSSANSSDGPTLEAIRKGIATGTGGTGVTVNSTTNPGNLTASQTANNRLSISSTTSPPSAVSIDTVGQADTSPTFTEALGIGVPSDSFDSTVTADHSLTTEVIDSQGNAHNINIEFVKSGEPREFSVRINAPKLASDPKGNDSGRFVKPSSVDSSASGVDPTVNNNSNDQITGTVEFNPDGSLKQLKGFDGVNDADGSISLGVDYNEDNATAPNGTNANGEIIDLNFGTPRGGGPNGNAQGFDGLTQFDSGFAVNNIQQDGIQFGNFTGVQIDEEGVVTANFDNGQQKDIYKIPVARFNDDNGLGRESGNVFTETQESGEVLLNEAGVGGAGEVAPSSLERSTVDLSEEFSDMIQTQRAYSANTRVLSTSDQMLQTLSSAVR